MCPVFYSTSFWTSFVSLGDHDVISLSPSNRVTGVYEVSLCHLADAGSPGRSGPNPAQLGREAVPRVLYPHGTVSLTPPPCQSGTLGVLRLSDPAPLSSPVPRNAAAAAACSGHVGGVRPRRGEPGGLASAQRQPHPGAPMGAGETQPAAGGTHQSGAALKGPATLNQRGGFTHTWGSATLWMT